MTGPLTRAEAGHALATLALALAYGTDRDLTTAEADAVVGRLHARAPDVTRERVERLVHEAARTFGRSGEADAAAEALGRLAPCMRAEALGDLRAVASADGHVHGAERRFLAAVAKRWGLPDDALDGDAPATPTPVLVDLAVLAVAVGFGADGVLADAEAVLVRDLLRAWHREVGDGDPDAALALALRRGGTGRDRRAFADAATHAGAALSDDARARVVRDLTRLANADGRFLDREEDLLGRLVDAWGVGG